MPIRVGQRISQLVIREIISRGGQSTVVRAVPKTGKGAEVALKIAHPDIPGDPYFSQMLRNEVEILRHLDIPGVVRILPMTWERRPTYVAVALELHGSPSYYAMELLGGKSLRVLLRKKGRESAPETALIANRVASILDRLHENRMAHNDIKSDNVVFRRPIEKDIPPEPVLVDFGTATSLRRRDFDAATYFYTSPEKLEVVCGVKPPEAIEDATKSDVWSLGVMLYEMLTGRFPFAGKHAEGILTSIRRRQIAAIRDRQLSVSKEFEDLVVYHCLALKPAERPSARELATSLGLFIH